MKASTKMIFELKQGTNSTYVLKETKGKEIENFTCIIQRDKSPELVGKRKINFEQRKHNARGNSRHFDYCFVVHENGKTRMLTSFNFSMEHKNKTYGDFHGYGLLINFSNDMHSLDIFFIPNAKYCIKQYFNKWIFGASIEIENKEAETKEKAVYPYPRE